jgi:hypothetical protein
LNSLFASRDAKPSTAKEKLLIRRNRKKLPSRAVYHVKKLSISSALKIVLA